MAKPGGLGRGLASLIPTTSPVVDIPTESVSASTQKTKNAISQTASNTNGTQPLSQANQHSVVQVRVQQIHANPYQPRHHFEHSALEELTASIKTHGILQPLVVTPRDDGYQLIAGERRFRAAQLLSLETVPVLIRTATDQEQLELALIENLQRQNLSPLEYARAYERFSQEFSFTQQQIADRVGKSRSSVANTMRLLQLPSDVQDLIAEGKLTEGHAKLLLEVDSAERQSVLAKKIVRNNWTIRETAQHIKKKTTNHKQVVVAGHIRELSPVVAALQEQLQGVLGTKVRVSEKNGIGKITIEYFSDEERDALAEKLSNVNEYL